MTEENEEKEELSEVEDKNHVKTGEKPSSCFQTKQKVLEKISNKSFFCTQCGTSFSLLQHLKEHQKIHTGVREYMCFECEKTFTTAKCLKAAHWRETLQVFTL